MAIMMERKEIVSASDVVKNFSKVRNIVKNTSKMFVFKNNKPDMVLVDFNEYENLLMKLDRLEDELILNKIKERDKNDNGIRHSLEDIEDYIDNLINE
ncbi:MAG: type II toxin-antitoxin system Phd/YefM family antitoxin [Paeniclostridium sordellii]|nr:type II toxin-antitoxin system Phd/YefM family antitoxin [Paeniclostridium sordellii]